MRPNILEILNTSVSLSTARGPFIIDVLAPTYVIRGQPVQQLSHSA